MSVEIVVAKKSDTHNLTLKYSFAQTPYGEMLVASTGVGVCALWFAADHKTALNELARRFRYAHLINGYDNIQTQALEYLEGKSEKICLHLKGTPFQHKVWSALLDIPRGNISSYRAIAEAIGHPRAYRAVGSAVGANPIAVIIPCHRVLPTNGHIGNYRWGTECKARLLDIERRRNA